MSSIRILDTSPEQDFFLYLYFFPLEYAYSFLFSYSVFRREENFKSEMQLILLFSLLIVFLLYFKTDH